MTQMWAYNNPNLNCIQVDDATNTPPTGQDWQIDATASYSNDCSLAVSDIPKLDCLIYPNPAENTITIQATKIIEKFVIYNLLGQEVIRSYPNDIEAQIDISKLPVTTYIIKVQVGEQIGSYQIVKK
jgi:hypothetical protein